MRTSFLRRIAVVAFLSTAGLLGSWQGSRDANATHCLRVGIGERIDQALAIGLDALERPRQVLGDDMLVDSIPQAARHWPEDRTQKGAKGVVMLLRCSIGM
jgi:hypothetical protein